MNQVNQWIVGEWIFYQAEFNGRMLFGYAANTVANIYEMPKTGELYNSLDHAMVAAVAEKHTGKRGAGGTGVGTAADWFMKMIGAGQIREAGPEGGRALMEAVREHRDDKLAAHNVERALESQGYVIARSAIN